MRVLAGGCAALVLACASTAVAQNDSPWWQTGERDSMSARLRERVIEQVSPNRLRAVHELLGSEPHIAGTDGDWRTIERLAGLFRKSGLGVHVDEIWPYLSQPISANLEVITLDDHGKEAQRFLLSVEERELVDDPLSSHPNNAIGFNAYSGSGAADAEVVYVNHGTREDFQKLSELGISARGKIAIARYGGNFRGYKAYYAQRAGAKGLIIYTDPAEGGFASGETYPDGGYANESYIQRGSILTLDYPGDPLTPFVAATEHAPRVDRRRLDLPRIPVQPVGYGAAREILSRMVGEPVPEGWQGGFEFPYAITGGNKLRVNMEVQQKRDIMRTANVIGTIAGASEPDKYVIIGCHHDAWCAGAADPLAGTIVLMECARVFGEAAQAGLKPARTLIFAAWGAEEFGIIGSTEWCEANADMLTRGGVAYINLDMASMGLNFGSSASPSMRSVIARAADSVLQPDQANTSVLQAWLARGGESQAMPAFGTLGGGSDHVGFYCRLGIPSGSLGGGGSKGLSYHSVYDSPAWYQKVVGNDYASAQMVTQVCAALVMELADSPILPIDPRGYADDGLAQLAKIESRADDMDLLVDFASVRQAMQTYRSTANDFVSAVQTTDFSSSAGRIIRKQINTELRTLEQTWLAPQGLPGRPWYASLYGAPDPYSGYAAWVFPALRLAVEERDATAAAEATAQLVEVYRTLQMKIAVLNTAMERIRK